MLVNQSLKTKLSKKIGAAIKHYRSNKNLSQEKQSFMIGADRTYISTLEQGNKIASVYCLYKLSEALEINIKDFFDFTL